MSDSRYDGKKLTPVNRLKMIAEMMEQHDNELLAADGPVPQEPSYLRRIYLLAIRPQKEPTSRTRRAR